MRRVLLLFTCLFTAAATITLADDAANEARFITNARQLIFEGKRSGEGYFSPDGQKLIFQSEREEDNPFYQMYILDLRTGDTTRVSPGFGKTTCGFFQPGTNRVLFASTHEDPEAKAKQKAELDFRASGKVRRYSWDYDATMDIFSSNQDGSDKVNLTHTLGYDAEGGYSPDGKQIVFCSLRGAFPLDKLSPEQRARYEKNPSWFGDIYIMNADGSNVRQLTNAPGYDGGPFFSPDGTRIVWRHFDENGMIADVWTMKTDGSDKHRVTDFKSMSWAPFYHPSGKYIIFTSNKLGFTNFELFIVDVNGEHEPVRVTYTDGFDGLPVFSPDGKKISWTSGRTSDGKSQIFLADWNDQAALQAIAQSPLRAPSTSATGSSAAQSAANTSSTSPSTASSAASTSAAKWTHSSEVTAPELKSFDEWLADPAREGRETGTEGAKVSADYISGIFHDIGLQPLGGDYREPFEFNAGARVDEANTALSVEAGKSAETYKLDQDFRPLAFSESGSVHGEVVFAGYGLSVPEDAKNTRYNSYDNLDVKDKIVLFFRYVPESVDQSRRAQLNRYAGLRYKAMMARERGAKAVLIVTGPNSPGAGELVPLTNDGSHSGSGIIAASVSTKVADALLASSGKNLKDLQTGLDTENPHADGGFLLHNQVTLSVGIVRLKKSDANVVGMIPPSGGSDEYIIVGAHYDHLGHGGSGSSMARAGEEGRIHPGADDNASGTSVVLGMAIALDAQLSAAAKSASGSTVTTTTAISSSSAPAGSKSDPSAAKGQPIVATATVTVKASEAPKPRRGIIFALWSGEEIGLIGSAAFCEHPPVPLAKVAAYVNFDMVGRLRDNRLTMQGVGSSRFWRRELEKRNVAAGFNLILQEDPYLPTDTTSFYPKRVPVLNFFTGSHEDYHRPTDTPDKINAEGMERIEKLAQQIVLDLATTPERPNYGRVQRSDAGMSSRDNLRVYLGTIPDYSTEVKGVKLSGVRGGSPAEKGGLQGGDVIVEFAGQKIANIYDYTYALDAVKIGTPVKVIVQRDGRRTELTVTPEVRK